MMTKNEIMEVGGEHKYSNERLRNTEFLIASAKGRKRVSGLDTIQESSKEGPEATAPENTMEGVTEGTGSSKSVDAKGSSSSSSNVGGKRQKFM